MGVERLGVSFKFEGITEYLQSLRKLEKGGKGIVKMSVYDGAGLLADEIRARLEANIKHPDKSTGALIESMGIADMRDKGGEISTKIGFYGYDDRGVPNHIKAAVMESGRTGVKKRPFIRPAVKAVKERAIDAMDKRLNEEIEKIMEE